MEACIAHLCMQWLSCLRVPPTSSLCEPCKALACFRPPAERNLKVGLRNGTLLWKGDSNSSGSYSDGGAVIGPNGVVYTCSYGLDTPKHSTGRAAVAHRAWLDRSC